MDALTIFIKKPVFATMIILSMVVMGLFSYFQLGMDSMPKVDYPLVTISTTLDGAGPEEIESEITKPVEDAVAVIGGIRDIKSTSQEGLSSVQVMFNLDKNSDVATQEVRDKVNGIIDQFPDGTKTPIIAKVDPEAVPVMILAVHGKRDPKEITELCKQKIRDDIESVEGVGQVNMLGARYREIDVFIHADKLTKYQLPIVSIKNAIVSQNTEIPGGRVTSDYEEYTLRTYGRLKSVEAFNNIVVKDVKGTPVKIRDIGYVVDGTKEARTLSRLNGEAALTLQVIKSSDANIVKVVKGVKKKLKQITPSLPKDIHIEIVKDSSIPIEDSVNDIMSHLVIGGGLACIMVFMFMGSFRSTLIAAIAIPSSIISTFTLMKAFGFTLNNITLLALALVVGIVIDDAIVVLENIWRLIEEEGLSPYKAAVEGTKEIGPAVIATTLSLVILFLPIAFMSGIVGQYFKSYGITMAVSILISMVVSFVLTPVSCSKLLKTPNKKKEGENYLTKVVQDIYEAILKISLKFRFVVILLCIGCVWWGGILFKSVGKEFITPQDEGDFNVVIKLPKGMPIPRSSKFLVPLEKELSSLPSIRYVLTSIGTQASGATDDESSDISQCLIYVRMEDYDTRKPYTWFDSVRGSFVSFYYKHILKKTNPSAQSREIIEERKKLKKPYTVTLAMRDAREILKKYPLFRSSVQRASSTGGLSGADLQFSIQGDDLKVLAEASDKAIKELSKIKGYVDLDTDLEMASPEVQVTVNREKAPALGVDLSQVSDALRIMVGGQKISNYQDGKWLYDVRLRLVKKDRDTPQSIKNLYVPTQDGKLTYLAGIADIKTGLGPSTIHHYNRQRMVTIQANLEDYPQQTAMNDAKRIVKSLNLPPDYNIAYQGSSKYMQETFEAFAQAFLLAVIFMYMVLASQFENLLDPLIILLTLPLSVPFALLALQVSGMTLNMFSTLGLFLLFGVVKKNAILQIDHTNNLRKQGLPYMEAIIKANRERVRPILMTTLTLVVGMLPVALAGPEGATRAPMAVVVIGGQSLSLLLTLLLIPVAMSYVYDFERIKEWKIWQNISQFFSDILSFKKLKHKKEKSLKTKKIKKVSTRIMVSKEENKDYKNKEKDETENND